MTFADGLYGELLERGIQYFLPDTEWSARGPVESNDPLALKLTQKPGTMSVEWLGQRHELRSRSGDFTDSQARMARRVGNVLQARHQILVDGQRAVENFDLFRGVPEDRYVSAYLDPQPLPQWGDAHRCGRSNYRRN